jgi:hypothetical protein
MAISLPLLSAHLLIAKMFFFPSFTSLQHNYPSMTPGEMCNDFPETETQGPFSSSSSLSSFPPSFSPEQISYFVKEESDNPDVECDQPFIGREAEKHQSLFIEEGSPRIFRLQGDEGDEKGNNSEVNIFFGQ